MLRSVTIQAISFVCIYVLSSSIYIVGHTHLQLHLIVRSMQMYYNTVYDREHLNLYVNIRIFIVIGIHQVDH